MKLVLRFTAVLVLFSSAVCALAALAHNAEQESKLIQRCRAQLAGRGLENVNVVCRGERVVLRGKVASPGEKALALELIRSLDGILDVSSNSLIVARR